MAHMSPKGADPAVLLCPHPKPAWQEPFCYQLTDETTIPREAESRKSSENGVRAIG